VQDLLAATAGHEDLARTAQTFDHVASDAFVARTLTAYDELREEPPLVSVVLPTKDRARAWSRPSARCCSRPTGTGSWSSSTTAASTTPSSS
jgi:hypothetical protein